MKVGKVIAQVAAQPAHPLHVLLVVQGVDHRAGREEQQALKKACMTMWKMPAVVVARALGQEHVAELRDGRVGEHPFDVVLGAGDGGGEQGGGRPDAWRSPTGSRG